MRDVQNTVKEQKSLASLESSQKQCPESLGESALDGFNRKSLQPKSLNQLRVNSKA